MAYGPLISPNLSAKEALILAPASPHKSVWLYTDGACSGNPGPGGWAYLARHEGDVWAAAAAEKSSTNNRMELQATIQALRSVRSRALEAESIALFTDSSYVLKGIQEWLPAWVKRGWKKIDGSEVLNRDLWELLSNECQGLKIQWVLVPGHSAVAGNDFVDEWAVEASQSLKARDESWSFEKFPCSEAFSEWPRERESKKSSSSKAAGSSKSKSSGGKAFYVSYVKGQLVRHPTWSECEARVKGTSGARFKKVTSESELGEVLKSWGLKSG